MKPTHILVPIEFIDDLMHSYTSIPVWSRDDADEEGIKILKQVSKQPKADLSEEGINNKATAFALEQGFDYQSVQSYKQCAKDILNTNP